MERRTAEITYDAGKVIFKQDNVEVPKGWSILATKVVVSKYFYGENGTSEREPQRPPAYPPVTERWPTGAGATATSHDRTPRRSMTS